jgi:hypothetical protein
LGLKWLLEGVPKVKMLPLDFIGENEVPPFSFENSLQVENRFNSSKSASSLEICRFDMAMAWIFQINGV